MALAERGHACLSPYDVERNHFPYPDDMFSLIISQQMVEHMHSTPKLMLDEVVRVLKPGGAFVLDTPNIVSWTNRIKFLRGETIHWDLKKYYDFEFNAQPHPGEYFGHVREYTPDELASMARWAGLEVETATSIQYGDVLSGQVLQDHFMMILRNEIAAAFGVEVTIAPRPEGVEVPLHHLLGTSILVTRKPG